MYTQLCYHSIKHFIPRQILPPHSFIYIYIYIYICILSSATTASSTLYQGRFYPHIHSYIYIYIYINSILIHKHLPWQKKGNTTFYLTMRSYDGAETYEFVGSFLLSQLQNLNIQVGLYRDDRLAIINATPKHREHQEKYVAPLIITVYASPQKLTNK